MTGLREGSVQIEHGQRPAATVHADQPKCSPGPRESWYEQGVESCVSTVASIPFSVLDRSRTRQGQDGPTALRDTVRFARRIEALGYHRFWVSEHHSVPGVAGSAPTVLAAAVAAATSTIRV
ncbi:Luciferase-like monooxygenase, partial [Streptomyces sp. MnatMP-M17]